MRSFRKVFELTLLFLCLLLYLPTLCTVFLTDDFLDCQTDFRHAGRAFTTMLSSGYRPLMSYSWAMDRYVWGISREYGWHITNILILVAALVSLHRFIVLFVQRRNAVLWGLAVFAFSTPVLLSVAKVVWRTSLVPLIPLLWSMHFMVQYSRKGSGRYLFVSALLFLVSLLLKETALALPPAFAALAWWQSTCDNRRDNALKALLVPALAVGVYLAARYLAIGFAVGYSESSTFGIFMGRNCRNCRHSQ
jgi:hypothetical protein